MSKKFLGKKAELQPKRGCLWYNARHSIRTFEQRDLKQREDLERL